MPAVDFRSSTSSGIGGDPNGSRAIRGLDMYTYDKRDRSVEAQTAGGAVQSIYDRRGVCDKLVGCGHPC